MNKQILVIGLGQLGCAVADTVARAFNKGSNRIHTLAIDTDARTFEELSYTDSISMAFPCRISDVLSLLENEPMKNWFPCDRDNDCVEYFETLSMNEGANQWRMKAMLSFYYYLSGARGQNELRSKLKDALDSGDEPTSEIDLYVVASLAGGTGSGLLLPFTLYLKRLLKEEFNVSIIDARAILALPDVCESLLTAEQQIKARANTYATVRELNGITANALGNKDIRFRLGDESDTVFGLLYDSEAPEAKTEEAIPFSEICLFKRIPCVNTVSVHVEYISDAICSLFAEENQEKKTASAPYGIVSVSKTVYPDAALEKYITNAYVNLLEDENWLIFAKQLSEALTRRRSSVRFATNNAPSEGEELIEAINDVAHGIYDRSGRTEAFFGKTANEDEDDVLSADELFGTAFAEEIDAYLDGELSELGADSVDTKITLHKNLMKSKPKDPLFITKDKKDKNVAFALECGSAIKNLYESCREEQDSSSLTDELFGVDTDLSVYERLLKSDGEYLNPVLAMIRLSGVYTELKKYVDKCKTRIRELNTEQIPHWITCVDTEMQGNCTYDTGENDRFERLISGDASHVGGRLADRGLIIFDLESASLRIKHAYKCRRLEKVLATLESIIKSYHVLFSALADASALHTEQVNELLHSYISRPGLVNFVGSSIEEKTCLFSDYTAFMAESKVSERPDGHLDALLGSTFASLLPKAEVVDEAITNDLEKFIGGAVEFVKENENTKAFVDSHIKKNVLQLLMSSDGKNGSDKSELALSKAFCAATDALRLIAPDSSSSYLIMQNVCRDVRATLPIEAEEYLTDKFGPDAVGKIMDEILYNAGEYEARYTFSSSLPSNELRMTRHTSGIKLCLLESFNEESELPVYRKAYVKALKMKEHYMTDMWDPHLVVGVCDTDLPLLSE